MASHGAEFLQPAPFSPHPIGTNPYCRAVQKSRSVQNSFTGHDQPLLKRKSNRYQEEIMLKRMILMLAVVLAVLGGLGFFKYRQISAAIGCRISSSR